MQVAAFGTKVTFFEQNWLIVTFNKFLGVDLTDMQNKILAFSLYAKVKLLKTKQNLDEDNTFIEIIRFLQAYRTDFKLQEIGKDLKKCYQFFERLKELEKENKLFDVGALEFDRNGILVGVTNNRGATEAAKFFDFEEVVFEQCRQNTNTENEIF